MRTVASLLLIAGLIPATAHAKDSAEPTFWMGPVAGFGTYAMGDINDDIQAINAAGNLSMDEITKGFAYGVQFGINLNPVIGLSAGFERMNASSDVGGAGATLEYNLPANLFFAGVQYSFPSQTAFHFGLGGLLGIVSAAGDIKYTEVGQGVASGDVSGSSVAIEGRVLGDYYATPEVVLSPSLGYRLAKLGEFKINNRIVYMGDGSKMALDYSGVTLRLALKFLLN